MLRRYSFTSFPQLCPSPRFTLICSMSLLLCFHLLWSTTAVYNSGCSVNFKVLDYSILTSQCKGPPYKAEQCCQAFYEFACPYSKEINDVNSYCASDMFSYINLVGKYPPGLFARICREGNEGIDCSKFSSLDMATKIV